MEKLKVIVTAILSAFCAKIGMLAIPLLCLMILNLVDYKTAISAAPYRNGHPGERAVRSDKSIVGIFKKVRMYYLVIIGFIVDYLLMSTLGSFLTVTLPPIFAIVITCWLIFNEIISILENLDDAGEDIPPFLLPLMRKIRGEINASLEDKEKEEQ